jgi:Domain of unknown function (DUF932)
MANSTSTLLGAEKVSRQDLAKFWAPASTATWRPIQHAELADIIQDRLEVAGYRIQREQYAVQTKGLKLFGTLDLTVPGADSQYGDGQVGQGLGFALGFRHSNDKSLALQMVGGSRVFVCDNLALSGDVQVFRNKHTHGVYSRLRAALGTYVRQLGHQIEMMKDRFGVWQAAEISDDQAKVLIYDAIAKGVIPSRIRPEVHAAYFDAARLNYEDCAPRTAFGLHNSFTRAIKALSPAPAYEANLGLTGLFSRFVSSN